VHPSTTDTTKRIRDLVPYAERARVGSRSKDVTTFPRTTTSFVTIVDGVVLHYLGFSKQVD
jgi:hypothetical protein